MTPTHHPGCLVTQAALAQEFAAQVFRQVLTLRGWSPSTVTTRVRTDIFAMLDRHGDTYSDMFGSGLNPECVAKAIQYKEWDFK